MELWNDLYNLNLSHNFFTSFDQPPLILNLQYLDLNSNSFKQSFSILSPSLLFSISNNKLIGEIPSSICYLNSIEYLDLSNNSLAAIIPQCLGSIKTFWVLNLQMNNFHGTIPRTFARSHIEYLNLNGNHLDGLLPPSLLNYSWLEILARCWE